jgi:hypothetical protein
MAKRKRSSKHPQPQHKGKNKKSRHNKRKRLQTPNPDRKKTTKAKVPLTGARMLGRGKVQGCGLVACVNQAASSNQSRLIGDLDRGGSVGAIRRRQLTPKQIGLGAILQTMSLRYSGVTAAIFVWLFRTIEIEMIDTLIDACELVLKEQGDARSPYWLSSLMIKGGYGKSVNTMSERLSTRTTASSASGPSLCRWPYRHG